MTAASHRIVSLLPSATEIVCALDLDDALVGVSHECDWPAAVRSLPIVTHAAIQMGLSSGETDRRVRERLARGEGLYALDAALLHALAPTLIITQALCEVCAIALPEVLRVARSLPTHPPVLSLEPSCLADIFGDIARIAEAADVPERAEPVIAALHARLAAVEDALSSRTEPPAPLVRSHRPKIEVKRGFSGDGEGICRGARVPFGQDAPAPHSVLSSCRDTQSSVLRPRVALLEWLDPPFVAGHWGPEMIAHAGGTDTLGSAGEKSVHIHWEQLRDAAPEVIVVAPCGYDVARARADLAQAPLPSWWDDLPAVRTGQVFVMDGNAFISRPGPRVVEGTEILARLLHPDAFADGASVREQHTGMSAVRT